jgi:hypothetical protein
MTVHISLVHEIEKHPFHSRKICPHGVVLGSVIYLEDKPHAALRGSFTKTRPNAFFYVSQMRRFRIVSFFNFRLKNSYPINTTRVSRLHDMTVQVIRPGYSKNSYSLRQSFGMSTHRIFDLFKKNRKSENSL